MIEVRPFEALGRFENEWLNARYHFSFSEYRDPQRMGFGPLWVWNDDRVRPGQGFAPHGHRDMEIITYIRRGAITHEDHLGNRGRTEAGDVQVMSAGTGTDYEKLVKWYDLNADLAQFRVVVNRVATTAEKSLQTQKPHFGHPVAVEKKMAKLSSKTVGDVEGVLQTADISPYVRRQPVCVLLRDKPPVMVFEEIYVSIKDLRAQLFPKVDLHNARWLFQQLTLSLDRQVLVMLNRESDKAVAKVSINLNVPTLLGDDFLKFDSNLKASSRGGIIIEINKVDVFYDLGAFRAARDFLRKRGYRVAIDGVTPDMLSMIDRENLEADFVKVFHRKDQAAEWQKPGVRAMIEKSGQARIIMSRCDSPDSVETGQGLGINLFQGYYVKKLLDAARHGAVPDSTRAIAGRKPAAALPGNSERD